MCRFLVIPSLGRKSGNKFPHSKTLRVNRLNFREASWSAGTCYRFFYPSLKLAKPPLREAILSPNTRS